MQPCVQRAVKGIIRNPNGNRRAGNVEEDLLYAGPAAGAHTLRQDRAASQCQGFSKVQLSNADEDKEKIDGDGPSDLRQFDLKPRSQYGSEEIGPKSCQVTNLPSPGPVRNSGQAGKAHDQNKESCFF